MWTFLRWALMVTIAVIALVPLAKMLFDWIGQKVPATQPIATYVDKA